jgi:diguanylate cyclase (GGDEF)-like protein
MTRLHEEFSRSRRYETPLSFVLFELDQLAEIRERYGQEAGESALIHVHDTLHSEVRKENIQGRWSDTTFATILPGSPYRGAAVFANKVRADAAADELPLGDPPIRIRVSAGISAFESNRGDGSAEALIQAAERALAEARRRGGNRVHVDRKLMGGGKRWILLADVDLALLEPAEDLLTLDGYCVVRAESPQTVLAAVRKRLPDLLLIDLQMAGVDADGLPLVDQVRSLCHEHPLRVVGLAGPDFAAQPLKGSRLRVDRYLTKPFSVSVLRSVAHDLLEHPDSP